MVSLLPLPLLFLRDLSETSAPSAGNALAVACFSRSSLSPDRIRRAKNPRIGSCRIVPTFPTHPTHPVQNSTPTIPNNQALSAHLHTHRPSFRAHPTHPSCASFGKPHPKPHPLSRSSNLRSLPAPTFGNHVPTSTPASMRFCFAYPLFHAQRCTTTFYYLSFTSFLRSTLPPPKTPSLTPAALHPATHITPRNIHSPAIAQKPSPRPKIKASR